MPSKKRQFGDWGEAQAVRFLRKKGYRLVTQNYQVRRGEIDIIAWNKRWGKDKVLCFIEVKTRRGYPGSAEYATNRQKRQRLFHAAQAFCREQRVNIDATPMRFEHIGVYVVGENVVDITHFVLPV